MRVAQTLVFPLLGGDFNVLNRRDDKLHMVDKFYAMQEWSVWPQQLTILPYFGISFARFYENFSNNREYHGG